jgi:alcohol dehydrogenase class IV
VLPYSISFNAAHDTRARERYEELAGFVGRSNLEQTIIDLRKRLNVPETMRDLVPDEEAFRRDFDTLVQKVLTDVATPANPVEISADYASEMLKRVYYGK